MTNTAAFGTWKSPISAADVAGGAVAVSYPSIAGGEVWWQERRPSEGGRTTIVASAGPSGEPRELLPQPWNARTRVHEYGGKSYLPVPSLSLAGGVDLVFANFADQRLYAAGGSISLGNSDIDPVPLTPADGGFRFADMVLSPDGRDIWCVRETVLPLDGATPPAGFHVGGGVAVKREIVAVPLDGSASADASLIRVLVHGAQFFAFPTPSPDGTRLAWINWNHPNMPWDGTELRVAPVSGGPVSVADAALVIGGREESVLAPLWRDDATLYVISDASGWWNLYEVAAATGAGVGAGAGAPPRALHPLAEEFAGPLWQLGGRPFELLGDGRLAVLHGLGELRLGVLDPASGSLTDVDLPGYRTTDMELAASGTAVVAVAGGPRTPWSVLRIDPDHGFEIIKSQPTAVTDPAFLPVALPVRLSVGPNDGVVHAIVYPPANPGYTGPVDELPPFLVHVHGGPTSNSVPVVSMEKAYFTSRGIGVVDVNYGGSTGYGRAYRERLRL
ncbi:MAG: S9 family peptidase, partial [Trebonia sp.]